MKFEIIFRGATYRVAHAEPKAGESVVMDAQHLNPDGTLVPIPYLTKGVFLAIDCQGGQHVFGPGGAENTVFPQGRFSVVATEDSDYWCISPLPGSRLVREGKLIIEPEAHAVLDLPYETNAVFTDSAYVNGTVIPKGTVARVSPGLKNVSQPNGRELHIILFNTEVA